MSRDRHWRMPWLHSHSRLVERIAKRYWEQGIELEVLIAAGHRGLQEAARRFDPGSGIRFDSYASGWIRAYVRARTQGYTHPKEGAEPGAWLRFFEETPDELKN